MPTEMSRWTLGGTETTSVKERLEWGNAWEYGVGDFLTK